MEEHIDVVTSTDPCINTDDSIDMQDGTSLCDSETKTDSDESDLEEANRNSQVETVEKLTSQGPTPPEQIRLLIYRPSLSVLRLSYVSLTYSVSTRHTVTA